MLSLPRRTYAGPVSYTHLDVYKRQVLEQASLFESREYFAAWQAVKNGFYKAALRLREPEVFEEACRNFSALLKQEMDFAAGILEKDRT